MTLHNARLNLQYPTDAHTQIVNEAMLFWIESNIARGIATGQIIERLVTSGAAKIMSRNNTLAILICGETATAPNIDQLLQNWCATAYDRWFLTAQDCPMPDISLAAPQPQAT